MIQNIRSNIDLSLKETKPSTVVALTALFTLCVTVWVLDRLHRTPKDLMARVSLKVPFIRREYEKEISKERLKFVGQVQQKWQEYGAPFLTIPERAISFEEAYNLIDRYDAYVKSKIRGVHFSGTIYPAVHETTPIMKTHDMSSLYAYITQKAYLWNSLHMDEFDIGYFLQYQVVQMIAAKYGAQKNEASGFVTSGGTESLMLAVRTYSEWGMKNRGQKVGEGVILAAPTIHAAVLKGCQDYKVNMCLLKIDERGGVDLKDLAEKLHYWGDFVVAVFASAPAYGTGTMDPIPEIATLCNRHKVPFHVDACLGGFIVEEPFFKYPGVTSISVDTHKNGRAPKGSSVLAFLYDFADFSIYCYPDWEVAYGTPKAEGSQSVVPVFQAFITLLMTGLEGYRKQREAILSMRENIIRRLPVSFVIVGEPQANVVAFKIREGDLRPGAIYHFAHEMKERKFVLNPLKGERVHLCITELFTSDPTVLDKFITAVHESYQETVKAAHSQKKFLGEAGVYGSLEAAFHPDVQKAVHLMGLKKGLMEVVKNILLGKRGASEAVRSYISARLQPYRSSQKFE